jgi:hypothetical protein
MTPSARQPGATDRVSSLDRLPIDLDTTTAYVEASGHASNAPEPQMGADGGDGAKTSRHRPEGARGTRRGTARRRRRLRRWVPRTPRRIGEAVAVEVLVESTRALIAAGDAGVSTRSTPSAKPLSTVPSGTVEVMDQRRPRVPGRRSEAPRGSGGADAATPHGCGAAMVARIVSGSHSLSPGVPRDRRVGQVPAPRPLRHEGGLGCSCARAVAEVRLGSRNGTVRDIRLRAHDMPSGRGWTPYASEMSKLPIVPARRRLGRCRAPSRCAPVAADEAARARDNGRQ